MSLTVFLAVIAAAALHAGWNAVLKIRLDPFLAVVLINAWCAAVALALVPFFGLLAIEAWPWLAAATIVHVLYAVALTEAYRRADMGQVYPVARGSAPLMTAILSFVLLGEKIGLFGSLGVLVIALGIMSMAVRGAKFDKLALGLALTTGATITSYTLLDGIGARASGNPHAYAIWLFILDGAALLALAAARRGQAGFQAMRGFLLPGMLGGVMSLGAYWIAIWAMTQAPIGLVAAVRESSVLFGAAIAILVLREPLHVNRLLAAGLILAGLVLIRLPQMI